MTGRSARDWSILGVVVALGTCLRCYHLADRPVWFDEAFSYTLIGGSDWSEMVARTAADVHPPLYYATLRCWTACFGASPVAMRSLSVVMAAVTMVAFYLLCRDSFYGATPKAAIDRRRSGPCGGLIAALLIALSTSHVSWSYETRMYTLATALLGLSTWALVRALRASAHAGAWWTLYTISATAMVYTHNYALFSFAAQVLFAAAHYWHQPGGWRCVFRESRFRLAAAAIGLTGLAYLPWLPILLEQRRRVQAEYWIPQFSTWSVPEAWLSLIRPLNARQFGSHAEALAATAGVLCVITLVLRYGGDGSRLIAWMSIFPVALAMLISWASASIIVGRYLILAYMFVLCGVGRLVALLPRVEFALCVALIVASSSAALHRYRQSLNLSAAPGVSGAMDYVLQRRRDEEPIVVSHPFIYFPARYYARDKTAVHLYLAGKQPRHFTGAPILRPDDCWKGADIEHAPTRALWLIDATGLRGNVGRNQSLPAGWSRTGSSKVFHSPNFVEGDVIVGRYERIVRTGVRSGAQ